MSADNENEQDIDVQNSRFRVRDASGAKTDPNLSPEVSPGLKDDFVIPDDCVDGYSYGIDVSHWQGSIDWGKVASSNPAYAYIKATQGQSYVDPHFQVNAAGASTNGLVFGCYHFLSAEDSLQQQIENFLTNYESVRSDRNYPPCLDIEWDYDSSGVDRWAKQSASVISEKAAIWMEAVKVALGVEPIFYTNKEWWECRLGSDNQTLADYGAWMSCYGSYDKDEPPLMNGYSWVMWQFTNQGQICGISCDVDVNLSAPGFSDHFR